MAERTYAIVRVPFSPLQRTMLSVIDVRRKAILECKRRPENKRRRRHGQWAAAASQVAADRCATGGDVGYSSGIDMGITKATSCGNGGSSTKAPGKCSNCGLAKPQCPGARWCSSPKSPPAPGKVKYTEALRLSDIVVVWDIKTTGKDALTCEKVLKQKYQGGYVSIFFVL